MTTETKRKNFRLNLEIEIKIINWLKENSEKARAMGPTAVAHLLSVEYGLPINGNHIGNLHKRANLDIFEIKTRKTKEKVTINMSAIMATMAKAILDLNEKLGEKSSEENNLVLS